MRPINLISVWRVYGIGKLELKEPFETLIPQQLQMNGMELMPIEFEHTAIVSTLQFHHKDPFDRLMAAQSMSKQIPIVSADPIFDAYNVIRLW